MRCGLPCTITLFGLLLRLQEEPVFQLWACAVGPPAAVKGADSGANDVAPQRKTDRQGKGSCSRAQPSVHSGGLLHQWTKKDHQRREPASTRIIVVSRQTATKHHVPLDTPSSPRQGQRQRRPWRCCRMDDRRAGGVQLHRRTAGCSLRWAAEALDDQRPSTTSPGIENDHCYEQAIRNETPRAA